MINNIFFILVIAFMFTIVLNFSLTKSKKINKTNEIVYKYFTYFNFSLMIHLFGLILQIMYSKTSIPPIYFDYITYVGNSFSSIFLLCVSIAYSNLNNAKEKINKIRKLYVIPIIFLLILFTNDFHHLFYKTYSIYLSETEYGPVLILYALYSYGIFTFAMAKMVWSTIKKSGFFSIQMLLISIGMILPILVNLVGVLKIFNTTIYYMPLLFSVTSILCYISIVKMRAFNVIPVASRTVMDTMSDGYVVISNDGTIADSNKTFREKFKDVFDFNANDNNLFETFDKSELINLDDLLEHINETRKLGKSLVEEYHFENEDLDRYFEVDIHPISARNNKKDYIATLLVFKDVTQHQLDIQEIKQKQDIIVKQQQLVSIGELAGGVAHDINTPISAIKTGIVMLNTMSGERNEAEKEIIDRMDNCATKIINIVNSMRNQIRNLGGTTKVKFKVSNVLNDIKVITYHEACKNNSEINLDIKDDVEVMGDPTKLSQVLTNLIVNAIQAYGTDGGKIDVIVSETNNKFALINVIDYAGGIDEEIVKYVFKNILTTKGTAGTGLGLYIAYSVIKGEFNGEIDFNTAKGEGTTFSIKIPIAE